MTQPLDGVKKTIMALALECERMRKLVDALGIQGVPTDPVEATKQDIRYHLAVEALSRTEYDYREMLAATPASVLREIASQ